MKCIIDNIRVRSIATCLPEKIIEMSSYAERFGEKEVETTIKASGIERVHATEIGETAADLCYRAAELILEQEKIDRSTIDGLILVSQMFMRSSR